MMEFRIADTFTDSLARLAADEQKAVKTTVFDLQVNPASPGLSFHKLDKAKDKNFWSVRVSSDIRLIVHRSDASLLICYVDHHDKAYAWAERRKLETHPTTGAAQLVEIRETVRDIVVPRYVEVMPEAGAKPPLFAKVAESQLLSYGVPPEWLGDVRQANEDTLLTLAQHLPSEAAEALLELATGGVPHVVAAAGGRSDPFAHPDARRRFRVMKDVEELERAFEYPWDRWSVFLHPAQQEMVDGDYAGPARVAGSAGTGKTIVALHRAVFLTRENPDARVLLTTFSEVLANNLRTRIKRLISNQPRLAERLEVASMDAIGRRLFKANVGQPRVVSPTRLAELLIEEAAAVPGHRYGTAFLLAEWEQVVDAWQLQTWEAYRDVRRLGRKTRLPEAQRKMLWAIFSRLRDRLMAEGMTTDASLFTRLAEVVAKNKKPVFDFAVVDEAQDVSVAQLRFLAALAGSRPNGLFFAGDLGQRIFQQPFSWKALGVDVRGRARSLYVNYRTSHQIRIQADKLLAATATDADGNTEDRGNAVSVFDGPAPRIHVLRSLADEASMLRTWLSEVMGAGLEPHEIGIFVRSEAELPRASQVVSAASLDFITLDGTTEAPTGFVSIGTMHLAKGLEFRAVAVVACDDEVIPLQRRIESATDDGDLEDIYSTERQLLYVACTRAREHLLVTAVAPGSEFLEDMVTTLSPG